MKENIIHQGNQIHKYLKSRTENTDEKKPKEFSRTTALINV